MLMKDFSFEENAAGALRAAAGKRVLRRVEVAGKCPVPSVCAFENGMAEGGSCPPGEFGPGSGSDRERLEAQAREEARNEGFREGYRDGRELAMAELRGLVGALETVRRGLENGRAQMLKELEKEITALALEIAEKLALQEITANPEAVYRLVRKVIEKAGERKALRVRLSPEDCRRLREGRKELLASLVEVEDLNLVEDESLSAGDCVVETPAGIVDGRMDQRLERIRATVLGEEAGDD